MSVSQLEPGGAALQVDHWEPWFAWRPVKLYMTGHYAWLRRIYRRTVVKTAGSNCEYTDDPQEFPDLPKGNADVEAVATAQSQGPAATA
jgi:hypothetical protein